LVIETSLYYDARSENHQINVIVPCRLVLETHNFSTGQKICGNICQFWSGITKSLQNLWKYLPVLEWNNEEFTKSSTVRIGVRNGHCADFHDSWSNSAQIININ
jgi:hypothetical protein